jgi:hypothetical protein
MRPELEAITEAEHERVGALAASMPVGRGGIAAARAAGRDVPDGRS